MKENKPKSKRPLHVITPFIVILICTGVLIAAGIKPFNKLKTYINIAFMDTLKSDPLNDDKGLVIKENNIITDYNGETSENGEPDRPEFGELYAVVSTDALGINVPIYWGTTTELLEYGACQSSSSVVFGTSGNSVISAHVDTYFSDLEKIKKNDEITVYTNYGKFTYTVSEIIEFNSKNKQYIAPTKDDRLTIYTCKRDLLGASDLRIGAVCELTEKEFYTEREGE